MAFVPMRNSWPYQWQAKGEAFGNAHRLDEDDIDDSLDTDTDDDDLSDDGGFGSDDDL